MKKLFYGLALSLSFLCSPMIYANLTDGQKCMQGFLHDCLDTIDTNALEASLELSKGYGAQDHLKKIYGSWSQLRMYLISSGLTYYKAGSKENRFESQFCKPIDEAIEHIKKLNKVEDQHKALLDLIAKIHLVVIGDRVNQFVMNSCESDGITVKDIPLEQELLEHEYNACVKTWNVYSSAPCAPLEECKKRFASLDTRSKGASVGWTDVCYSLIGLENGSLSERRAVENDLQEIHKQLLIFKKKFLLFDSPCMQNEQFSIVDIKNIRMPQPAGMFSLEALNPAKWELVQKSFSVLFFALNNSEIKDDCEKILKKYAETQTPKAQEPSIFMEQLGGLLKRAVISQELEDAWTDIASHTKSAGSSIYEFWSNYTHEVEPVYPAELQVWQSLCSSLKQKDHEILLQDLAEYVTRKNSVNLHKFLFPASSKFFSKQKSYEEVWPKGGNPLFGHNKLFEEFMTAMFTGRSEDFIKDFATSLLEKTFEEDLQEAPQLISVEDQLYKELKHFYDIHRHMVDLKIQYCKEFSVCLKQAYPEYEDNYISIISHQWYAIMSGLYQTLLTGWFNIIKQHVDNNIEIVFDGKELDKTTSDFDRYVTGSFKQKEFEKKELEHNEKFKSFWYVLAALASPNNTSYLVSEDHIEYDARQRKYNEAHNRYETSCASYLIASSAKGRLQKKIEKQ